MKNFLKISLVFICAFSIVPISIFTLSVTPTIPSQGVAHRIFYWHVPIAWVALYAPIFAAIFSILYLVTRKDIYDSWTVSYLRIALIFSIAVLFSGPMWAKTEWGTYWNWKDSRLVTFFILFLILCSYFLLRKQLQGSNIKKVASSLVAVLASFASLLTWFAIRWMEPDTHPPSVLNKMSPLISIGFWLSVIAFHLIFWIFIILSVRHEKIKRLSKKIEFS